MTDRKKAIEILENMYLLGITPDTILEHFILNHLSGTDALKGMESFKEENLPEYDGEEEDEDLIATDKNGDEIYIGASVNVDSPDSDESWNFEFEGTIIEIRDDFAIVEDMDGDCFSVAFKKFELA